MLIQIPMEAGFDCCRWVWLVYDLSSAMTHSERRTTWWKEGLITLGTGFLYGGTSVLVGHPFDTIKTKMQVQSGFENRTMVRSFVKTVQDLGVKGLYRGWVPPFCGSIIFRSSQFAVFEAIYTYMERFYVSRYEIPLSEGVQLRVICGGIGAGTVRAIIETPLEYAKVRRQIQKTWKLRDVYRGFGVTWSRTVGLWCTYIILFDSLRRHYPNLYAHPILGPFLMQGVAATLGWWVVWPLEFMKSQVQGKERQELSVLRRMQIIMRERGGFFALYRGIMPGSLRSFVANGTSMIVMTTAQRKASEWGLRN